jgi:SAM-dependent methyltransferase
MSLAKILRMSALCSLLMFAPTSRAADTFAPQVGQAGKDVIWVPTPDALVARMLDMAKVTPQDSLVDLGSGDGRTVIAAAKRGVKAMGIEYNPDMVALSRRNAEAAGVGDKVRFVQGDIFATDFSQATVVTMYLLSSLNLKLRPTLLAMKPGTRVVSHAFTMGDWPPDETANVEGYNAYLWIVPAKIQGRWHVSGPGGPFDMTIDQTFQKFTGKVSGSGLGSALGEPSLRGSAVSFTVTDAAGAALRFRGEVKGDVIEGSVQTTSGQTRWTAKRVN